MNIFKYINDLCAIIRSCIKSCTLNIFNCGGYSSHAFVRIQPRVKIVVDSHSHISIGKGALLESNTKISATDGGYLTLGKMVGINRNCMIMCHKQVTIGDNTIMGPGVCIYDHDHLFDSKNGVSRNIYECSPVIIGNNCWIGAGAIILRGTQIGDNCLIAAGCVLKGYYADGSIVIQKREETIKQK